MEEGLLWVSIYASKNRSYNFALILVAKSKSDSRS